MKPSRNGKKKQPGSDSNGHYTLICMLSLLDGSTCRAEENFGRRSMVLACSALHSTLLLLLLNNLKLDVSFPVRIIILASRNSAHLTPVPYYRGARLHQEARTNHHHAASWRRVPVPCDWKVISEDQVVQGLAAHLQFLSCEHYMGSA